MRRVQYKILYLIFPLTLLIHACCVKGKIEQKKISFTSAGNELSGTLVTPSKGTGPFPTVVFVHGDGALNFDAYGYYSPIWEALAARGIASFSWDKPGVGDSTGKWQLQSMKERAQEVSDAIYLLNQSGEAVMEGNIGVIGFSQAGWVLPLLSELEVQPAYMIFVSTAVSWERQGEHFTRSRLNKAGASAAHYTQI